MPRLLPQNGPAVDFDGGDISGADLSRTRLRLHYYGRDVRVEIIGRKSVPPDKQPTPRDEVGAWSAASRKRLLWLVNNCGVPWATLLTLTYPETWPIYGRVSQVHLANLLRSMKRTRPDLLYLWVKEYQTRGAQHFHMLLTCFGEGLPNLRYRGKDGKKGTGPYGWKSEHRWVSRRWQESISNFGSAAGYLAGCRWELLDCADGGARYISQYASKVEQKTVPEWVVKPGRWWGHSQSVAVTHGVPFAEIDLAEYLAGVDGQVASEDGWLFGVLHNGAERAARWRHLAILPATRPGLLPETFGANPHVVGPQLPPPRAVFPVGKKKRQRVDKPPADA